MSKVLICVHFLGFFNPILTTAIGHGIASSKNAIPTSEETRSPWLQSQSLCYNSTTYNCQQITCSNNEPLLEFPYCATYNEDTKLLSLVKCPYFQPTGHNVTLHEQIILPRNLSQLNNYMCGPLNRKGLVCSECADGFGPSVTSFKHKCVNCTDAWYRVPLFLVLNFVPITILYLVILVFQISITSAPMPCFIMYAQYIVIIFDSNSSLSVTKILLTDNWDFRLDMQIILTLYGLFNLDFCHYDVIPAFCINSKLKSIHVALFGYIAAFYPMLLIFVTWICVELHGRNFRPLVWLWRPFHRCFVQLRRGLNAKNDIIDVFCTFFVLSYSKILYQTILMIGNRIITNINEAGKHYDTHQPIVDQTINYGSSYHLAFAIPSLFICLVFNILPPLLLILYPIRAFRSCLSKCNLNLCAMHMFTDKIYDCYRNGLDGGRDMRSFSGLYFFLRLMAYLPSLLCRLLSNYFDINKWFILGTFFCIASLFTAFAKPYRQPYMNVLDAFLLLNFALLNFIISAGGHMLLIARVVISTPIALFFLIITLKKAHFAIIKVPQVFRNKFKLQYVIEWFRGTSYTAKRNQHTTHNTAAQPLIQPTSTVISYGADDNDKVPITAD